MFFQALFTGSARHEEIRLWDLRARKAVYDLASGNNAVNSLAWDAEHNVLYAATECAYVDRLGYNHGYREAKISRQQELDPSASGNEEEYRCWPETAFHNEGYFGYAFDAGDHRICEIFLFFFFSFWKFGCLR